MVDKILKENQAKGMFPLQPFDARDWIYQSR